MTNVATLPRLTAGGVEIDTSPERFGWLRDSNDALGEVAELRRRMEEDGYLYLPGFLNRSDVQEVRRNLCDQLSEEGLLHPDRPREKAIARPGAAVAFRPDLANDGPARPLLERTIYGERMMGFYGEFLGGEARHFDYTWLRVVAPGRGTYPHTDVVFMGRGTKNLYTAWVPLGDVPLEVGGLILIEGSHRDEEMRNGYSAHDVDTVCEVDGTRPMERSGFSSGGSIGLDMAAVQQKIGGRLLTAKEFRMGDLLTFSIYTVHGSLDNGSDQIRMSSDSRYQLASDPVDERWVGDNPPGHGGNSVKGLIC
ncbi:phytanoyl-CoA dioxygenase [bacterium]|nr:MAG: phytanoyl-CoA dioxygenase [bacterium]